MPTALDPLKINKLESSATGRALKAIDEFGSVSTTFVDFTTGLVRDIFRTLVDSSIEQLEAYAELVAKVSGSLADYEQRVVGTDAEFQARGLDYLKSVIVPSFSSSPTGTVTMTGTFPSGTYSPTTIGLDATKLANFKAAFAGVNADLGHGPTAIDGASDPTAATPTPVITESGGTYSINTLDLHKFCIAKLKKEVKASYDRLVMILKMGMQKLVVTDGEIKTSLTFHVDASDSDSITSSQVEQDYSQKSTSWGVNGGFGGSRSLSGKLAGNVISRSLGGSISGGVSSNSFKSRLKVNVMNEKKTAVTNTSVDITGGVTIHFKSDYFPSVDPAAVTP